ncbi:MAG: right-handed parallel beta-helix repeat-containing protein [Candidatus Binatia bacterium]|nr:right-handed parallel beta-helix repeat-containing protein [Candidatus Binatia bacterium]MDG1957625.1 right-handed parallel beta-helix repeat-containing protein [Candidatus Binatia bacterium]MDG2010771.1 right-handed parallel beta-helix repeat-containing protein [Candidatus Binatia bacterium]HAC79816.1 hypothetical protein [Deltaproteobacteria bacterium]
MMMRMLALVTVLLFSSSCGDSDGGGNTITVNPGESLQEAVDAAPAGSRILVNPGTYVASHNGQAAVLIEKSLHLIANVVDGETAIIVPGPGNTEGILVQGTEDAFVEDVVIRNFSIQGFEENGIWTRYVDGFEITDNDVGDSDHVGIYPTLSANGLVRDNIAYGGTDSALWVTGAEDIRVINNTVHTSPTGLEVTVSERIEMVENVAYNNVVGIGLYHDNDAGINPEDGLGYQGLTGLVARNNVYNNNLQNPATGGVVADLPTGLGILVLGNDGADIQDNTVTDNGFAGLVLIDWCLATEREDDDCKPDDVRIVGNTVTGNGTNPPEHPFAGLASDVIVLSAGERNCMADNTYGTTLTPAEVDAITEPSCPPVGG